MPRAASAFVLLVLVALAGTMTYTGYLVVGVLSDLLGTGRFVAGLLLGALFARIPWVSNGKLRTVGMLPKIARRPVMVGLLALCLWTFLIQGDFVPAMFTGFTGAFILIFPWLKRALFGRLASSFFKFPAAGQHASKSIDSTVIDVEFKEKKD
jgi:hypothetical protein